MIANRKIILGAFVLLAFASLFSFTSALEGAVLIAGQPEVANWIADGQTVYRLDVLMDNTGLPNQNTDAIEWRLQVPSYLTIVSYSQYPSFPENDFFTGMQTMNFFQNSGSYVSIARLAVGPPSVNSNVGNVASYWFTVNSNAPRGQQEVMITDVEILDSTGVYQDYVSENAQINIVSPPRCRSLNCAFNMLFDDEARQPIGSLTAFLVR